MKTSNPGLVTLSILTCAANLWLLPSRGAASPPSISAIANQTINEDSALGPIGFRVTDAETPASSLSVSVASSNPTLVPLTNIVISGIGTNRSVQITPAANKFGSSTITLTVVDTDGGTASQAFIVTVAPVNDAPTLDPIANVTIAENSDRQTVMLTGISSGSADEIQTLSITAVSTLPSLIPNPIVSYTSPGSTGALNFTPVANAHGTATITVYVNDGGGANNLVSRSFQVTVTSGGALPVISPIADRVIDENTQTGPIPFTVSDGATPASSLIVSTHSSNPTLVPPANIVVGGSGTNRAVTVIPAPNTFGKANITLTVSDPSGATASTTFSLTVNAALQIAHAGPNVILTWTATNAVLQECDQISGTWQDVAPLRTSPCTMPATGLKFLRLRESTPGN